MQQQTLVLIIKPMATEFSHRVIYLHGFLSSANAYKAQQLKEYLAQHHPEVGFDCPQLFDKPAQSIPFIESMLKDAVAEFDRVSLVGSSLGGFYANYFAHIFDLKAALINPALEANTLLQLHEPFENPYTHSRFALDELDHKALEQLLLPKPSAAARYLLLLQMADEVLDAKKSSAYYSCSPCVIEPCGNHQFENFEKHLPLLAQWLLE